MSDSEHVIGILGDASSRGLVDYVNDPDSDIGVVAKDLKWLHAATVDQTRSRELTAEEVEAWKAVADTGI